VDELRYRQSTFSIPGRRTPSDEFHDRTWLPLCKSIADAVNNKLNRPLTAVERRKLWRSRSPLILEVGLKEIQAASTADEVNALLAKLPPGMDRPDPTGWCDATTTPP
jgi:hypothetical protein